MSTGPASAAKGGLQRLARLYGLVERSRAMELGTASAAVMEAERAEAKEAGWIRERGVAGRVALEQGDAVEWAMVQVERAAGEVRARRIAGVRVEREEVREQAREAYQESRLEMEQMESVVERARVSEEMEAGRRRQAESDDRYLARREWVRGEEDRQRSLEETELS